MLQRTITKNSYKTKAFRKTIKTKTKKVFSTSKRTTDIKNIKAKFQPTTTRRKTHINKNKNPEITIITKEITAIETKIKANIIRAIKSTKNIRKRHNTDFRAKDLMIKSELKERTMMFREYIQKYLTHKILSMYSQTELSKIWPRNLRKS
jgi:hypothetical protein